MKKYTFNKKKWFFELGEGVPYDSACDAVGISINKIIYQGRSRYQKIEFYSTKSLGKILVLDGVVQTSEKDEFIYHEMLCHPPLFLHPAPKKILILGGGDGGSLEEALKHPVDEAWMAEIDEKVIDLCKKHLPSISKKAYQDRRAKVIIGDGKKIINQHKNFFDVVILDLSDPHGPSEGLISENFYREVKKSLKKEGIVSIQSGSFFYQPKLVKLIYRRIKNIFPLAEIRKAEVPAYHAGEYSFILGLKASAVNLSLNALKKRFKKLGLDLNYYSPEIHFSSKILPKALANIIKK